MFAIVASLYLNLFLSPQGKRFLAILLGMFAIVASLYLNLFLSPKEKDS